MFVSMSGKSGVVDETAGVSREFVRLWRIWQNSPPPVENCRLGRDGAPTWGIECDLDHLCTWISGLGVAVLEARPCNFSRIASEDRAELWRIELELERIAIPEKIKKRFRKYLALTRLLLEEITRMQPTKSGNPETPKSPHGRTAP